MLKRREHTGKANFRAGWDLSNVWKTRTLFFPNIGKMDRVANRIRP